MILMRPGCSTTKILPSSRGCVRKTGAVSPPLTKGSSLRLSPEGNGPPPSPGAVESLQPITTRTAAAEKSTRIIRDIRHAREERETQCNDIFHDCTASHQSAQLTCPVKPPPSPPNANTAT